MAVLPCQEWYDDMNGVDFTGLTLTNLIDLLESGEVTSELLTRSFIKKIKKEDAIINSFITTDFDKALQRAVGIDEKRKRGLRLSKIAGIPIAIKDNIVTKDLKTTCGSKMLEDFIPFYDASVVKTLKENGVIILGKLNMDEFGMGSSTENSYFFTTKNPNHLDYVAGGSSGGSAAAVRAGLVPISIASDTGGSIRQPASFCGVVGFKPTYGRISRYGLIPFASSLDTVGIISKTVKDSAYMFNILASRDEKDMTSVTSNEDFTRKIDKKIHNIRVAFLDVSKYGLMTEDVVKAYEKSVGIFGDMGIDISTVTINDLRRSLSAYYIISSCEASSNLARYDGIRYGYRTDTDDLEKLYRDNRTDGFGLEVKRRIMMGTFALSHGYYDEYYKKATIQKQLFIDEMDSLFKQYDVLLTPVVPTTAFKRGARTGNITSIYETDLFTAPINLAGLPAISINVDKDGNGLPIGVQLVGRKYDESTLLQVAHAFERTVNER